MLAPDPIYAGSHVDIPFELEVAGSSAIAPTSLVMKTINPNGTEKTYTYGTDSELTVSVAGSYSCRVLADLPGRWHYRWIVDASGTKGTLEGDFNVIESAFVHAYPRRDYS